MSETFLTFLGCTLGAVIGTVIAASVYHTIVFIKRIIKELLDK